MEFLVISLLILLNGFFALSEIALVSAKRSRLEEFVAHGKRGARTAVKLQNESEHFLSTIQVGITLIGIVTGLYGGIRIADDFRPFLESISFLQQYAREISLSVTVIIITYVSIVIGELVPKTVALRNPEKIACLVSRPVLYFSKIFHPFVLMLSAATSLVNSLLDIENRKEQMTESELRYMLKIASLEGIIEKDQNIIHERLFWFSDKKAKHIMTQRMDVEWIDLELPPNEIRKEIMEMKHAKIIAADGELDHFRGYLNVTEYYKALLENRDIHPRDILSEPLIVPEVAEARDVLEKFRNSSVHICFVVNEFGSFEGIITLHDIIENIIGQLPAEGEVDDPDIFIREDNSALVSGDAPVETLVEVIEGFTVDFETIDYSTVAGFFIHETSKIPKIGDRMEVKGYVLEIVDIDGSRIDKVLISKKA